MDNFTISDQYGEYSTLRGEDGKPVVLGRGGFGVTICAFKLRRLGDVEIRDEFALKILRYSATEDPKRRSRTLQEILALRDLQHPNLASYKDCGEDEGCIFLVMELCRGGDLAALAARVGALPERFALQVILQVCAGLDEAHRKGYFHRDLKPTNILISEEMPPDAGLPWLEDRLAAGHLRFKVVDFGLAGRFESEVKGGGFMGSPMFASPEQVREQRLDSRSDIYSLGMTLWYLVTGKGPLLNANGLPVADAREAMRCHTSPSQHDLAFPGHFSEGFRSLLGRMIRKAPDERFRSAQEVADAIRRQIEAMPAPLAEMPAQPKGTPLPKAPLVSVATWGTGTFAEYYHVLKQVGRRSVGTFYQARHKASGNMVGFTAWVAANSPNAASEKLIGQHLDRLKAAINDPLAPKVLTKILDWLRTTDEWCVAEEWNEGEKLDRFASRQGRAIGLEDAARLLWPLAEACDFLHEQGFDSALLSVDEIHLLSPRAESEGPDWIGLPMDEWGDWTIRLSALSIPQELAGESRGPGAIESSTTSRFDGCDAGQLRLNKSFCRLFYRLMEGAEAAVAADWDAQAFTGAGKLGAQSNALLRDYICGAFADDPMVDILKRICSHEGVSRIPGRTDAIVVPSAPPTRAMPVVQADPGASPASPPLSVGSTAHRPGSVAPSAGGSRSNPKDKPILATAPANQVEVAQLIPGRPGWVRSPYGRREQQISGPEWRENAPIKCQSTGRPFQLPGELPPLEAILIDERFDAVLTPYVDPPQEVAVPLGKWKPNEELTCALTGRTLRQPPQLPAAIATVIDDRPGTVRSPYGDHPEVEVKLESWKPGQLMACPASGQTFALPAVLPPLLAIPRDTPGSFISPYAPDRPFDLTPSQCLPNRKFECPWTDQPLGLPAVLPEQWQFEGAARQADVPEARSPYFEIGNEGWQPLDAADWRPGAIIQCRGTGRPFVLPATLPVLRVKAGPNPFSVCSPFPPHETISIPAQDWIAGTETSIFLNAGTQCLIALPSELPTLDRVEIAELESVPQGRQPQARGPLGAIRSPFVDDGEWVEISAQRWLPGTRVICPATSRPFWLPKELPLLEARLGQELGTVHSPYTDHVVKIPAADWIEGNSYPCPETGARFLLPHKLPWLEGGVDESRPGWVESPFDRGSAYLIEFAEWKPGEILECPTSERKFALPQSLPEWIAEAELDGTNPGTVRNPHGPGNWFKVPGTNWEAGATVHCPETQTKLALPAELPALEATLVEDKPGYVQSPYTSKPEQVRIHPSKWRANDLVECPITKRPLRLPENLPSLRSAFPLVRKLLIPAAAAVILTAVWFLVAAKIDNVRLKKFWEGTETEFAWVIPLPVISRADITVVPEKTWPRSVILVQGIEPADAAIYLASGDGERIKVEPDASTSTIKRTIQLSGSGNKAVQSWLSKNGKAQELHLELEAPGFEKSVVTIPHGKPNDTHEVPGGTELTREQGTVKWEEKSKFFSAAYLGMRFELNNPPRGHKDAGDQQVRGGSIRLPTGEYTATLIGNKGFSENRVITSKLNITKGKPAEIQFPSSIPQHLGGFGVYTGGKLPVRTLNKTVDSEVGKTTREVFNYWTPCLVNLDDDFRKGILTDENSLLGPNGILMLDVSVYTLAVYDQLKSPDKPLGKCLGYTENKDLLNDAFRDSTNFASFPMILEQNPEKLIENRRIFCERAAKIWASVKRRDLDGKLYEDPIKKQRDITPMNRWLVKLQSALMDDAWKHVATALLSPKQLQINRDDLAALKRFVDVNGKSLGGVFIEQGFEVSRVDELGRLQLKLKASFANPYDPAKPIIEDWIAVLQCVGEKVSLVGKFDMEGSREIQLSEVKTN